MLSLCRRAGKLVCGESSCEKALSSQTAFLVIVAEDASDNTKKKFENKAFYYNVPVVFQGTKKELGKAIGKDFHAVIAICDENFAFKINDIIK